MLYVWNEFWLSKVNYNIIELYQEPIYHCKEILKEIKIDWLRKFLKDIHINI